MVRVIALHTLNPPDRVVPACLGLFSHARQQCFTLSQKPAQTGIDESALPLQSSVGLRGLHHLVDNRVGRVPGRIWIGRTGWVVSVGQQQRQRRAQQRLDRWVWFALHQAGKQRAGGAQLPQRVEGQGLNARPQARGHLRNHFGKGVSLLDGLHAARSLPQLGRETGG